jgi:hypothetical protein
MFKGNWGGFLKLGERVTDLLERGVVALETLAGTPLKSETCEHVWKPWDETGRMICDLCAVVREKP